MKKALFLLVIIVTFFIGNIAVSAKEVSSSSHATITLLENDDKKETCNSFFGNPNTPGEVAYYMQVIFDVIKYLGIVLCIVLTTADFVKALINQEKDEYKSLAKTGLTRLIYAIILFLSPIIIKGIFLITDLYDTCGIK